MLAREVCRQQRSGYVVDHHHETGKNTLLFRTNEGSKLLGVVMNDDVAFEIDEHGEEHAMSVILRGHARKLEEDEEHRAENLPLRPWVPSPSCSTMSR